MFRVVVVACTHANVIAGPLRFRLVVAVIAAGLVGWLSGWHAVYS